MGWTQVIDVDTTVEARSAPTVTKKVWNGTDFVEVTYRRCGIPTLEQRQWLVATFGPAGSFRVGQYWNYSNSGNYAMMDEQVYTWFKLKWGR
jgi:hypothetical protein